MRKKIFCLALVCLVALCASVALTACDDGSDNNATQGTLYSIQAPAESELYTVVGLPSSARKGDEISFSLSLSHPEESTVDLVRIHTAQDGYTELTASADGVYSFTMPEAAVTVEAVVSYYPDNTTDNFLTWSSDNPNTFAIVVGADNPYYTPSSDPASMLTADVTDRPAGSGGYFTSHREVAYSLDTDVIPDEALSVVYETSSTSNSAVSFTVVIDRTMIKAGTAKIVLRVDNGHRFGDEAILSCTVTVTA